MKNRILSSILVLCATAFSPRQIIAQQIDLREFLPLTEGEWYIYNNEKQNWKSGEVIESVDSIEVRSCINRNEKYFYFWKNDPPSFFLSDNSFFEEGAARYTDDSLIYIPAYKESSIIKYRKKTIPLLPNIVELNKVYRSQNIGGQTVLYKVTNMSLSDSIDKILLEKAEKFNNRFFVDSLILKKGVGCIAYTKLSGEKRVLTSKFQGNVNNQPGFGKAYINSVGDTLLESQMIPAYLTSSDFSTAEYDSKCRLVKEVFFGTIGEMSIKYITYEYDSNGNLSKELYYYTEKTDPLAPVISVWLNEYVYNSSSKLIESRSKFNLNDPDYYNIESFSPEDNAEIREQLYSNRHKLKCY